MNTLSPAQLAYKAALDAIEAEKRAALSTRGTNADQLNITALRRMSAALVELRKAQHEELRS